MRSSSRAMRRQALFRRTVGHVLRPTTAPPATIAAARGERGAVYNLGSGQGVQIETLLDMLLSVSGLAGQVEVRPDPARQQSGSVTRIVCDASRFRAQTGWQPRYTLAETLRDLYHYWLDRLAGNR